MAVNQLYFSWRKHLSLSAFVKDFNFGNHMLFGLIVHFAKEFIVKIHCSFFERHIRNPIEKTFLRYFQVLPVNVKRVGLPVQTAQFNCSPGLSYWVLIPSTRDIDSG